MFLDNNTLEAAGEEQQEKSSQQAELPNLLSRHVP